MTITNQKVLDVMAANYLCTVSTLGADGRPQAALVGFAETPQGQLVIGTSTTSRKYQNIQRDGAVAIVIGGWEDRKTLQYQGTIREVDAGEREAFQAVHVAKHPANAKFKDLPDNTYLIVEPDWVRFTDAGARPWDVIELTEETA